jgi:hypothetical protein
LDEVLSNSAHKTENGNEEFIVDLSNSKMTPKLMQRDLKRRSRAPQNCRCTKKKKKLDAKKIAAQTSTITARICIF